MAVSMMRRLLGWQIDFAFHDVVQVCAFRGEHRLHLQLAASEMVVTHDTLDFLLRGDANLLQKFPHRHVEVIFFHGDLLASRRSVRPVLWGLGRFLWHLDNAHDVGTARQPVQAYVEGVGNLTKPPNVDRLGPRQGEMDRAFCTKADSGADFRLRHVAGAAGLGQALAE